MLLSEEIIKLAKSMELQQLLEAKKRSDYRDFESKNRILSSLLSSKPEQFKVDSELNERYVGLTHKPTGFRIHAPRKLIPAGIETRINETKKSQDATGIRSKQ